MYYFAVIQLNPMLTDICRLGNQFARGTLCLFLCSPEIKVTTTPGGLSLSSGDLNLNQACMVNYT